MKQTNIAPVLLKKLKRFCLSRPCVLCKTTMTAEPEKKNSITLDHIIAIRSGGTHFFDNVYYICSDCNSRKKHYFNFERDYLLKELNSEFEKRLPL